ncbi:MarR family winged helix-turn-helix transcriptional regulator [Alcaligenes endophyticus]|uniref:MarR family winged helix-turn-helix transcriptional regulator n=1 Tax=Alcaligenes endophyticus TaxID=1929088 RepID=A0ABT8EHB7_9BURK|nr:helix-turn-helix domain-containing protein [Alcaligenes endophyticus]MCX5589649.1 helix-turn-helix domain-containing protein [Alcaligenes endophyticus]MDN4120687.1 MarR family winged helix-turn-helix transcriptional regulator [Alcaligenes endophyticus]
MSAPTRPHLARSKSADMETVEQDIAPDILLELTQLLNQHFTVRQEAGRSRLAQQVGLSLNEYRALEFIQEFQGISARQLAQLLDISNGGMHALLKRLESANYIWKSPHPTDKRIVALHPNPARCADLYKRSVKLEHLQHLIQEDPVRMLAVYDFLLNQIIQMRHTSQQWLVDKGR